MLLVLNVQFYRNAPVAPQSGRFSETGGTIGRSPGNVLVLDDPGKYISRTHALVTFRAGQFYLADMGSNPSVVNDRPLGNGREVVLASGDRIAIGDYLLQAQIETQADQQAGASFGRADPLGLMAPAMAPVAAPANVPTYVPVFEPPPPAAPLVLPPLDGFGQPAPIPAALPPAATRDALASASILDSPLAGSFGSQADPLGLNLFGAAPGGQGGMPGVAVGDPLGVGFRGSANDHAAPERFAMPMPAPTPPAMQETPPPAPAVAAPAAPWSGGAIPDDYDPMADFMPRAAASAPPAAVPIFAAPPVPAAAALQLPDDFDPLAMAPSASAPASTSGNPAPTPVTPAGASFLPDVDFLTPLPSSAMAAEPMQTILSVPAQAAMSEAMPAPVPEPAAVAPAAAPAFLSAEQAIPAAAPAAAGDATLAALLQGLGLPDLQTKLTAQELAELVGTMLREATGGAMQTLMARSVTKRESRVEMTMIASNANNPLKFFPDADSALRQMLSQKAGGYMKPVRAFGNAFEDLQAHELAVMAGMRAALAAVLKRFDPQAIEQRLDVPTVMDKMMASSRKAKMWDRLVALYADISREADDDFQRLFGESFATAYEEQVDRMHSRGK